MPKLKGLLDSANAKLAGLLGDFPQGFNAGAVAGFPGWAGDMAYLADTARLALTGADSQAAPEDYVGTTDYIAKQAGYPVPQTLSGQLGAAVGGLMSPGPGDLAKFAPVLSAIPFWHGSPHKFDAFDLAHMGKGEGAQAYGWGAYGAESPEVAKQYAENLANINQNTGYATAHLNAKNLVERLNGDAEYAAEVMADQISRTDTSDYNYPQYVDTLALIKSGKYAEPLENGGQMYRGEYRWPDPAKEAATPLTGEDLLQWDRPLSEQSDSVKAALRRMPSAPDESVWPQWTGQQFYESEVRAGTDFDGIPKGDARRAHSKSLFDAGIPGIRYLDGQSRTDGAGTHNIVMFDDKGIKLLERNGSPIEDFAARRAGKAKPYKEAVGLPMDEASRMQRASEQGYNTDVYHGTAEDVTAFDPSKFGAATGAHSAKQGVWTVSDPTTAAGYAQYAANDAKIKALIDEAGKWEKKGDWDRYDNAIAAAEELEVAQRNADWMGGQNVMPLKVRGKYLEQDMAGAEFVDVEKDIKGIIARAKREGYDGVKFNNLADDVGRNARPATHVLTFDPKNIRAKTAAFDPKNKDSANLLAGTTAAAVGLGAYKRHSDEQRRRRVD